MMPLLISLAVLVVVALLLVAAFLAGRWEQYVEDAPRLRRARAQGQRLHSRLPHDGPYDAEMRQVGRHA